jgi:hypothetical protein
MEEEMSDIAEFTDDELSGIGIGPEHGVAKARLNSLIDKVNGMDTPSEFPFTPTTTTDWGGTSPTTVQEAVDALASQDNQAQAVCSGLAAQTDEDEVSAAINGNANKVFVPSEVIITVLSASGTVAADATLNVGTTTDGNDILSAQALTGLDAAGKSRRVPLAEATSDIDADDTLYANVESADSTATTLVLSVAIVGKQF